MRAADERAFRLFAPAVLGMLVMAPSFPALAIAQTPRPPAAAPAAPDVAFAASKRAFDGLPPADRLAIQNALVWTGDYNGTVDGSFGRGTRDAMIAFAQ